VQQRPIFKDVEGTLDETRGERWGRRAITGPTLLAMTPAYMTVSPDSAFTRSTSNG
jgi:hypothetical protein